MTCSGFDRTRYLDGAYQDYAVQIIPYHVDRLGCLQRRAIGWPYASRLRAQDRLYGVSL